MDQWEAPSVNGPEFAEGFFDRADPSSDPAFYSWPRLVTHIDDQAIAAVGRSTTSSMSVVTFSI